jgi:hypothetical protein
LLVNNVSLHTECTEESRKETIFWNVLRYKS